MPLEIIDLGWKDALKAFDELDGKAIIAGVVEPDTYEDGTTVATIGHIHEYGLGVPARPWMTELYDVTADTAIDISREVATPVSPEKVDEDLEAGARDLSQEYINEFDTLDLKPLAEATIARKGTDEVLFDTGKLFTSIDAKVIPDAGTLEG